ncbi:MAG TPA: Mrp/NBP35 family ATP-binding protein [Longimicrobiales bacterium]|nr:Mrp/NBP35 family ATP-binding protein [Longimicrobiales bacterium]
MNADELRRSVMATLAGISHPRTGKDLLAAGQVQGIEVDAEGRVHFQFLLQPDDPGDLLKQARKAVEALPGVREVKINVQLPQMTPGSSGGRRGGLRPGSVPAPTPKPGILRDVRHVIAVSSGKGGVGKSMVAANLAAAFAAAGHAAGLLDADIYGPDIPLMFGIHRRPAVTGEKGREMIEPLEAHGVRLMSLGFLLDPEQPAIMRGPLISGVLKQFLEQVDWGALDVMVVDMPPGTGDAQLSLVQTIDIDGALMVTTPQEVATGDVRRGIKMFERVNTRVLGVIENMSGLACPHCGEPIDVFGSGGGERLAADMSVPFLGRVPLDPAVRLAGDTGVPTVVGAPDSAAGAALARIAEAVMSELSAAVG